MLTNINNDFNKPHRALSNSTLMVSTIDGSEDVCFSESYQAARWVEEIEGLAAEFLQRKEIWFFKQEPGGAQINYRLMYRLKPMLSATPEQLARHFPHHRLHPHVSLFVECASKFHLYDWDWSLDRIPLAEKLEFATSAQKMLDRFRLEASDDSIKKAVKAMVDEVRRNCQECESYVDAIFKAHGSVLVLRVDFTYGSAAQAAHDWERARQHRAALVIFLTQKLPRWLRKARGKKGAKLVRTIGYVIGAEYGADRGWHFHATVFLNGDRWEDGVGIADVIGKHWERDITSGQGQYENCNRHKRRYRKLGIGPIESWELEKRKVLTQTVVTYGCLGCYFARALAGTKAKLMVKGEYPEVDPRKGGRPRSKTAPGQETMAMLLERKGVRLPNNVLKLCGIPEEEIPY